jgi:hypothetical protein
MEQEQTQLKLALRNGLFIAHAAPIYPWILVSLSVVLIVLIIVLVFPLIMGTPGLIAALGNRAVLERLETYNVHKQDGT